MQNKWICYIRGFLVISLKSECIERFFNMSRAHGIELWNIRLKSDTYICNIYMNDLFKMSPVLKKTKTKLKIIKKCGIPCYIPFIKKRIIFFIGIIACMVMLNIMTNYVWAIEYIGNVQISNDELTDFFKEQRIYYGIKKSKINCEECEKKLRIEFENITWSSIYFEGTKLFVEIKENEKNEPDEIKVLGSDIISDDEGIIISMITRNGIPKVKIGDKVEKGQILVEGRVPVYDEAQNIIDYQIYDADADIIISTSIDYEDVIKKSYPVINYKDNGKKKKFVDILNYHIEGMYFSDMFGGNDESKYEIITKKNQIVLLDNIYLPVYYGEINRKEYYLQYLVYTEKQMESKLQDNLEKFIFSLHEKKIQIVEKNVKIVQNKEGMEMKGKLYITKYIGKSEVVTEKETSVKNP